MNCIAPGPIETEVKLLAIWKCKHFFIFHLDLAGCFWQIGSHWGGGQDDDGSDTRGWVLEVEVDGSEIAQGRLGEIEEIANLATFLCSDYAR